MSPRITTNRIKKTFLASPSKNMYSSFPLTRILALFLGSYFVSVAAYEPESFIGDGYVCGDVHIAVDKLKEAVVFAKKSVNPDTIARNKYNGPPFTKEYLLGPIPAINGPYRVVLDDKLNLFSVVIKNENDVIECLMKEVLISPHIPAIVNSPDDRISYTMLYEAKRKACPKIRKPSKERFPARYDGDLLDHNGLQRYIFPVPLNGKVWENNEAPGQYFMIMNSDCSILGAISHRHQREVAHVKLDYKFGHRH